MVYYIKNGNSFDFTDEANIDLHKQLPVGTYIISQRPMGGPLFFQQTDPLVNSGKIYGDHKKNSDRIISTYLDRPRNTGVLLEGEKGSGKTLLARMVSEECHKLGIPTILINRPWSGEVFNNLVQSIDQKCMFLFDEFEKIYDKETQEQILTLLDGVYDTKKLFIFTVNNKWGLDGHLHNRPGRIFYSINYNGVKEDFIREYCDDVLKNKIYIDQICVVASLFQNFNFDMLKAIVEEMNRYNETPQEVLSILNANPDNERTSNFYTSILLNPDGSEFSLNSGDENFTGKPYRLDCTYGGYPNETIRKQSDSEDEVIAENAERAYECVKFTQDDFVKISINNDFIFKNKDGYTLILKKKEFKKDSFYNYVDY